MFAVEAILAGLVVVDASTASLISRSRFDEGAILGRDAGSGPCSGLVGLPNSFFLIEVPCSVSLRIRTIHSRYSRTKGKQQQMSLVLNLNVEGQSLTGCERRTSHAKPPQFMGRPFLPRQITGRRSRLPLWGVESCALTGALHWIQVRQNQMTNSPKLRVLDKRDHLDCQFVVNPVPK